MPTAYVLRVTCMWPGACHGSLTGRCERPVPGYNCAMRRRTLGTIVLLALLSMVGVVLTQYIWLRRAQQYQSEQVELQKQQAAQLDKQFNDRVIIALTDVTERILSMNKDPSNLFDAVKQVSPNYFAVTI